MLGSANGNRRCQEPVRVGSPQSKCWQVRSVVRRRLPETRHGRLASSLGRHLPASNPRNGAGQPRGGHFPSCGSPGSLDRGNTFWLSGARAHVCCDLVRESDPIFTDRLARIFLTRVIQTDTMLRCNEGRSQIPPQLDFLIFLHTWARHAISLHRRILSQSTA
jgi:hypothetical protein